LVEVRVLDTMEDFGMHKVEGDRLENGHRSFEKQTPTNEPIPGETPAFKEFLFKMSDLVDRYEINVAYIIQSNLY
jgi:hypothetical protein